MMRIRVNFNAPSVEKVLKPNKDFSFIWTLTQVNCGMSVPIVTRGSGASKRVEFMSSDTKNLASQANLPAKSVENVSKRNKHLRITKMFTPPSIVISAPCVKNGSN